MRSFRLVAAAVSVLATARVGAGDAPPEFGRYLPKYPATYYSFGYAHDARDSSFDQHGHEAGSAVPTLAGRSSYPDSQVLASFTNYFPGFEDAQVPLLSSTIYSMRVSARYGKSESRGAMADYVATNPEFAPRSEGGDRGIGDIGFEFGAFLWGAQDWRTRKDTPFALVLLVGGDAPVGNYEQTSPVTQGSNRYAWGASLGAHYRPWTGGFVEAGLGARRYGQNRNPNFGRLAPWQQGNDRLWNLSFNQRLFRGAYLGVFATDRKGGSNEYRNVRYAPNEPEPDPAPPGGTTESFPIPGRYWDEGTALRTGGVQLGYFVTPRLSLGLDWSHPLSGRSGQVEVLFRQRQCPQGSQPGASSCSESDMGPVLLDGQGSARSFASNSLKFSVGYNFGHSDLFTCTGCEQ